VIPAACDTRVVGPVLCDRLVTAHWHRGRRVHLHAL